MIAMKERIREVISSFFISVTLINVAMLVLGALFQPDQRFGYEVFLYPLIYGVIGVIPGMLINTTRELSVKQALIRKVMQMLLIIVLILAFMFAGGGLDEKKIVTAIGVAISIAVIYVLVNAIQYMLDNRAARAMTEDLLRFQENSGSNAA